MANPVIFPGSTKSVWTFTKEGAPLGTVSSTIRRSSPSGLSNRAWRERPAGGFARSAVIPRLELPSADAAEGDGQERQDQHESRIGFSASAAS